MSTTISRQIEEVFFDEVDNKYKMHMTRHDGLGNLVCEKTFPVGDYGGSTPVIASMEKPISTETRSTIKFKRYDPERLGKRRNEK